MNYKITKLDRRHNGYNIMKYIVEVDWERGESKDDRTKFFKETRSWFWENYGPGCELKYVTLNFDNVPGDELVATNDPRINSIERWAWDTEFGHQRLYLKSDAEMTFFRLKFT